MSLLNVVLTVIVAYFTKQEYDNGRYLWAIFWAVLLGWDLHTIITYL